MSPVTFIIMCALPFYRLIDFSLCLLLEQNMELTPRKKWASENKMTDYSTDLEVSEIGAPNRLLSVNLFSEEMNYL